MHQLWRSFVIFLLVILVASLLIATGFLGFKRFQTRRVQQAPVTQSSPFPSASPQLVGSDKDEHGCIGSAGYTWCEIKQKCLRAWEEPCETTSSDADAIKAALVQKHNWNSANISLTIAQNDGAYARGGVGSTTPQEGGGLWFAAKVNGAWHIVYDGNGIITCSELTDYPNFPATMIPECYDTTADKLIKR